VKAKRDIERLQIRASAAAWLARLRSETRTAQDEAAFQDWLTADPANAAAFETMNAVWDAARPARELRRKVPAHDRLINRRTVLGGAVAATGLGGVVLFTEMAQASVYQTDIGEQKHVRLRDGTEIFLDTSTKITVDLNNEKCKAALEYGCANFRLGSDISRPFAVGVNDSIVISSGSAFDVRRDGETASILLLQGRATVESSQAGATQSRVLNGGERLTEFHGSVREDKPDLLPLLAWHTGQAIFRNDTLVQAVREMNRYSTQRLEITDPRIQDLKVTGVYRVGDNLVFALALEALFPVIIRPFNDKIEIAGDDKRFQKI
jgi:transmembrane sensor